MTKKHYEAIAAVIAATYRERDGYSPENEDMREAHDRAAEIIAFRLAKVFAEGNPKFDRDRFISACRLEK